MHFSNKLYDFLKIIKDIKYLKAFIKEIRSKNKLIGFIPTMGSLHIGHVSLIQRSIYENDITICSIYVNPTQFNDSTDFDKYPRENKSDKELLETLDCDILFLPSDKEMYPDEINTINYNFSDNLHILEGEKRPGHFLGVITIVHKFLQIIQPDNAYFGEKDYQQLWLIKSFTKNFNIPTQIRACKTIRSIDGLALSSRNKLLTASQKQIANSIYRIQESLSNTINEKGCLDHKNFLALKNKLIKKFTSHPMIKLDYFEVIEDESFRFVHEIKKDQKYRVLIAAYVGRIRLIDNMLIE